MVDRKNIPLPVVKRLPRYFRFLGVLKDKGVERISSLELSRQMSLTASQIRQDLNCFGGFGQQGYGYNVNLLYDEIAAILGVDENKKTILIGAGNLGQAIARHMSFEKRSFDIIGIFDENKDIIGMTLRGHKVRNVCEIVEFCKENKPVVAVLCVPNTSKTEETIETLIKCGVKAFWNFTHIDIKASHPEVCVENVHLSDSLMMLCYQVNAIE